MEPFSHHIITHLSWAWGLFLDIFPFIAASYLVALLIDKLIIKHQNGENTTQTFRLLMCVLFLALLISAVKMKMLQ